MQQQSLSDAVGRFLAAYRSAAFNSLVPTAALESQRVREDVPFATANGALGGYSLSLFCGPLVALEYRVLQREGSCTPYRDLLGRALAINKGVASTAVDSALHHAGLHRLRSGLRNRRLDLWERVRH